MGCSASSAAVSNPVEPSPTQQKGRPPSARRAQLENQLRQAAAFEEKGDLCSAEGLIRQAIDTLEKTQPPVQDEAHTSWQVLITSALTSLARLLEVQGKHAEAVFHKRRLDLIKAATSPG